MPDRDDIFTAMDNADFDCARTVFLEAPPDPAPVAGPGEGTAKLVSSTTDQLIIEADLPRPAILLITDAYCSGWRARSLLPAGAGTAQRKYEVVPADYFLRGIPLAAGHHRLLVEYWPTAFVAGAWVSALTLAAYLIAGAWRLLQGRWPARLRIYGN